eukprot:CAMPEP_0174710374 /NCGR_PEP_ID=MMETSP1094-20130205/12032_1 /TAXON_ID=156173 /ORGANISM="Chrysochromulina brevifilum, Strain UTEX LB 985" /LENGTH=135 /DNA_ID=CAMNT_0015909175 /DNA_START=29 /DNA_END=434 /DNA_ORIENTATION=-
MTPLRECGKLLHIHPCQQASLVMSRTNRPGVVHPSTSSPPTVSATVWFTAGVTAPSFGATAVDTIAISATTQCSTYTAWDHIVSSFCSIEAVAATSDATSVSTIFAAAASTTTSWSTAISTATIATTITAATVTT